VATTLVELVGAAERLLQPASFQDYCPNGLQVEGRPAIRRLITGVTASLALLEAALAADADAVLVHHGYFWKNEAPQIIGLKRRRLALLLKNDISLLAYHLPLDAHPQYGNNARLAAQLDIEITGGLQAVALPIGNVGRLAEPLSLQDFGAKVAQRLGRTPLLVAGGLQPIKTIAWCSGGAQSYIEQAAALGVDAFLSGEISEQTVHLARELGLHFIAAGHHATERYGAPAVGDYLAAELGIEHLFIDIDNPA
jgi:dinuclear metal center YbgI/SA1388 family protein